MQNKNKNQFSLAYNKERQQSLRDQTATRSFYQFPCLETNKEEVQVVEGKYSFSQRKQRPEVRTYQFQSPQQNLEILGPEIYSHIYPAIKGLFPPIEFQKCPQAGRLQYVFENREKLTSGTSILACSRIFSLTYFNDYPRKKFGGSGDRTSLISSIFVVSKKEYGQCPVINLESLNHYIPCSHFKMERLLLFKETLQKWDYICKIDLKDAYFSVSLNQKPQKFASFQWRDLFYQLLCLCFVLGPAPRIFKKLIRIPISLLRKLCERLITFLDNILLMASSKEELALGRDTLIYLLQNIGFLIDCEKSVLEPCHNIQFFGYGNQLNKNDTDPSTRDKWKDCVTVPGSTGKAISLHNRIKPINWSPCINSSCSSARTFAVLSHVATINFMIAENKEL